MKKLLFISAMVAASAKAFACSCAEKLDAQLNAYMGRTGMILYALTADRNTPMKECKLIPVPMAAVKIFAGSLVAANATGYATPGAVAATLTYLGRAEETVDNTGGAPGAKTVLVRRGEAFKFANSGADAVTQASLGKVCYIVDDQTVALTSAAGTRSAAGIVVGVEADGVWVQ